MINVAEGRTAQILKEFYRRTGGRNSVALRNKLNEEICQDCEHSSAWHPDVRIGVHREYHCLYPGCGCSHLRRQEKSVLASR